MPGIWTRNRQQTVRTPQETNHHGKEDMGGGLEGKRLEKNRIVRERKGKEREKEKEKDGQ